MKIFKFGGASVKDAHAIRNVGRIIQNHSKDSIFVVVSAIGKTTNALEKIVVASIQDVHFAKQAFNKIIETHRALSNELFEAQIRAQAEIKFQEITLHFFDFLDKNESKNHNFIYDQIVSKGEILSSIILHHYLLQISLDAAWINAKHLIKTDSNYTDANILWQETQESVRNTIEPINNQILVTQGFIGANIEMLYTTLGREGSDYTAAILAYCLEAPELTIWKDVKGVYTADPKKFESAQLVEKLSYKEAIELTFYGAQIIHPKTIKPIQNSNCILNVRSFIDQDCLGTQIGNFDAIKYAPSIVLKEEQILYTFSVKDFSFLNERNLGKIIETFGKYSLRINLMQNTAIQFIVCTDSKLGKNEQIIEALSNDFEIEMRKDLKLLSIRHYNQEIIDRETQGFQIFLQQKTEHTIQFVIV
jgi:aspartate kinase